MTKNVLVKTLLLVTLFAGVRTSSAAAGFDQTHAIFDQVVKTYVKDARVNYAALQARPQELDRYLGQVAAVDKAKFETWTEAEQIAFLVNAYNAYTLRLIIDHYPVKSIKDIGGWFSGPWDQPVVKLFGKTMNLNTVEHKILRADHTEPRIHFALVCAAKGCPPLRSEAYVAPHLDEQLTDQAKQFLAETTKNRVDAANHTVYLSPIFKWYAQDFEKSAGSVLEFLKPFWPAKERAELDQPGRTNVEIRYTDYDWSLNEQRK